jgi:hypothetical protein
LKEYLKKYINELKFESFDTILYYKLNEEFKIHIYFNENEFFYKQSNKKTYYYKDQKGYPNLYLKYFNNIILSDFIIYDNNKKENKLYTHKFILESSTCKYIIFIKKF